MQLVPSCVDYAIASAHAEEAAYGSMSFVDYATALFGYLDDCNAAGGSILPPVFL